VRRLTATGLLLKVMHPDTFTLQQTDGGQASLRRELIHQASGEKIDVSRLRRIQTRTLGVEPHDH
jgi:hypothetical protein